MFYGEKRVWLKDDHSVKGKVLGYDPTLNKYAVEWEHLQLGEIGHHVAYVRESEIENVRSEREMSKVQH